jgi:hypothetical protein
MPVLGIFHDERHNGFRDLFDSLMKFHFSGVFGDDFRHKFFY